MTNAGRLAAKNQLREFATLLRRFGAARRHNDGEASALTLEVISRYDSAAAVLYRVRATLPPSDPFRREVEDIVASFSHDVLTTRKAFPKVGAYERWLANYRRVWRENFRLFLLTLFLALIAVFVSWHVVWKDPEFVAAFVPQFLIEDVMDQHKWFEGAGRSPWITGFQIAKNNIQVCLMAFCAGMLVGVGAIYILLYNFFNFGALFSFCAVHRFDDALGGFVASHGPLELTIIIASVFASLVYGRVFFMRPYSLFAKRMGRAVSDATAVIMGITPWLVVAASFEVFVSPWPDFPLVLKSILGLVIAVSFWVWTLLPPPQIPTDWRSEP